MTNSLFFSYICGEINASLMKKTLSILLSLAFAGGFVACQSTPKAPVASGVIPVETSFVEVPDTVTTYISKRPPVEERLFVSKAVEAKIEAVKKALTNPRLAWMFENCLPNTLDTTVHFDGEEDTFVYTGDIHAMWLRDSGAQVFPYVALCKDDPELARLIRGVVLRQFKCINIDPFANAFNKEATGSDWATDRTAMKPELHERKWEVDSPCYVIRLAYAYWKATGDDSIFKTPEWTQAIGNILATFHEQQMKEGRGSYRFQRRTERQLDTRCNDGWGAPVKPVGLIASAFRPSDDATTFSFLVPSNFFAVKELRNAAEILRAVPCDGSDRLAPECEALADEVEAALKEYAVYNHPKYGPIYAFEVDGFGNQLIMDDSNAPSLLSLKYLGLVEPDDPIYLNTRRFVWSEDNPYFFRGKAAEGIGGPHIGYDMAWPMSLVMRAFTATDDAEGDAEVAWCVSTLLKTDAGTGFMHEAFDVNDPYHFTRSWFAWANTLFGELIVKLVDEGKVNLLNNL